MPTYTQPQLQDRLKKLPQILQEAMFSPDIATKMFALGKKHGLTIDKIGFMAEETGYVILGFTKPREFTGILKARLEVDDEKAGAIASEINREIFYPLREELKKAHGIELEARSSSPTNFRSLDSSDRERQTPPEKREETTSALQPKIGGGQAKREAREMAPAPIDLRTSPTTKSRPEKPPLSELLPKAPPLASIPPASPPPEPQPKPGNTTSAVPPKAEQKTKVAEVDIPGKPEVMPGGGVFAPPSSFGGGAPHPEPKPQTAPMPPTPTQTQQPRIINTQQEKRYDPYRETVE